MSKNLFTGIQQVGIGVPDAEAAFKWYNKHLGLDVPVFDDVARAELMTPHTNGVVRERRAILAVNMAGGGGAEIWQSKDPAPLSPLREPKLGDLGIFAVKMKSSNVEKLAESLGRKTYKSPSGSDIAWLKDPYGNQLQLVPDNSWFKQKADHTGGVLGVIIGVSDMEKSLTLYKDVLGINEVVYDEEGSFTDFAELTGGDRKVRRVLLKKTESGEGAFYKLFGNIEIELVQLLEDKPEVIMEGRSWGDLGYIHLCFDTLDMKAFKAKTEAAGFPFTVDSGATFDMGEAGGRFSYIEDPDGTLLEFVETHKVPVLKKLGIFINLKKRGMLKPLPNWMISTLGWGKVKV
ncbi:VOC family protein [Jiulongibacter sediminis]|uniref:Glyoxalase n=1 Tax=Jiulongibacter sediminis TaxID=1605367 RepID=A0A0P7BJ26_9BACT|nr:VOC family protein [Jiulongibacter sediminis]KPM47163.1 glyoxalase [Jiulongibacter sediminis]TBX22722.1 glyoxalase [Jiulongibacter sediminis]